MPLVITQLKFTEESQKFTDGHRKQLMYVLPANFHIQGILAQTASPAFLAAGLPGKPAQHILVLDLVLVGLDPPEEFIQTDQTRSLIPRVTAFPYQVPHFLRKLTVRGEYGNMVTFRHRNQVVLEPAHLLAPPAGYGAVIYALAFVGNDQVLAYADDLSQSAAYGAGPERAVETEHILVRLAETDSVRLEGTAEVPFLFPVRELLAYYYRAPAHAECILYR